MASTVVEKFLSDDVVLETETIKGPPAAFRYRCKTVGFKKVRLALIFDGSVNFEVIDGEKIPDKPLQRIIRAGPKEWSEKVTLQQIDPKKGGSLSLTMSFVKERPDADYCKRTVLEAEEKMKEVLKWGRRVFPPEVIALSNRQEIEDHCRSRNSLFIDLAFPPLIHSLYAGHNKTDEPGDVVNPLEPGVGPPIVWRRPEEFMGLNADITLFDNDIEPDDIKQGALNDCWLMCAISSIAEFPELVRALFPYPNSNDLGFYYVRLCKNGEWVEVILDDYFPCYPEEGPVYSRAHGHELWVLLIEKAFAKLHGSYSLLRAGWAFEAMIDLTGAPYKEIRLLDESTQTQIHDGTLWEYMKHCDENGYIMSLSTAGTDTFSATGAQGSLPSGLVPGHAYTLIEMAKTPEVFRLCKIRNPWGGIEWNGDWSDKSPLWTPELTELLKLSVADDGTFWMSFDDVCKNFVAVNVCKCRHGDRKPWIESRRPFLFQFSKYGRGLTSSGMYKLTINESNTHTYISVHQQDRRCLDAPDYIEIGVTLLKRFGESQPLAFVASSGDSAERQNQLDVRDLADGEYIIIATSYGAKIEHLREEYEAKGQPVNSSLLERRGVLVFHSDKPFTLEEIPFDKAIYEEAMELPVIHGIGHKVQDLFGDGSILLYTRRAGYAGVSYVVVNKTEEDPIKLELDFSESKNVVSHRRSLCAACIVPPGEKRLIHHLVPRVAGVDWSASWSCKADWLSMDEMATLQDTEEFTK